MSNSEIVISVENLWKEYRYGTISHATLKKDLQSWWARRRGKEDPNLRIGYGQSAKSKAHNQMPTSAPSSKPQAPNSMPSALSTEPDGSDRFWALRDISFEVKRGEVLGIIGKNGAGKSTLLKIMSRVTTPTKGQIKLKGRVASLLEVGTGFHPELTGRENIFLNGAILGMSKDEIKRKFDEIVAFAEIEKFIDTPVKRYSSGMYVRLAFAVAAHLEPEILVVDEVLAVGDAEFQKKCLGKMGDVAKKGRTVLFVSHNMGSIAQLCIRCIFLNGGEVIEDGDTSSVIRSYLNLGVQGKSELCWRKEEAPGDSKFKLLRVRLCQPIDITTNVIEITKEFSIEFELLVLRKLRDVHIGLMIRSADGIIVAHTSSVLGNIVIGVTPGKQMFRCVFPPYALNVGLYSISIAADVPNMKLFFLLEDVLSIPIESDSQEMGRYPVSAWKGILGPGIAHWEEIKS